MKRSRISRKPRPTSYVRSSDWTPAARRWRWEAARTGCAMCAAFPVSYAVRHVHGEDLARLEGHHVVGKRHLKREGLEHLFWSPENALGLCRYHHERHERASQRVPRSLLPATRIEWAEAHGFGWVIDKEYA